MKVGTGGSSGVGFLQRALDLTFFPELYTVRNRDRQLMHAATFFDGVEWREGVVELVDGHLRLRDAVPASGAPRLDGVIVGGFTDHHVHLQLIEHGVLAESRLGRVVDLGGNPEALRLIAVPEPVSVHFAGAFLTTPGGYPSDRGWAPEGSVREIADAAAAADAVAEMADAGATCIKVTSNSAAGPVLTDDLFRTIVRLASARRLPVVAHAEGAGEARRCGRSRSRPARPRPVHGAARR